MVLGALNEEEGGQTEGHVTQGSEHRRGVGRRQLEQEPGLEDPGKPSDWPKSGFPGFPEQTHNPVANLCPAPVSLSASPDGGVEKNPSWQMGYLPLICHRHGE